MSDEKNKEDISVNSVKISGERKKLVSASVIFALFIIFLLYLCVLVVANIYAQTEAEENGLFHEILALILIIGAAFLGYVKILHKKIFVNKRKIKKDKDEAHKKEVELKERFNNGCKLLKNSKETGGIIDGIHRLIDVAIAIPGKRQTIVNLLDGRNQWMGAHRAFLVKQNLITWRLKGILFDGIDLDKQRITLEILTGLEKIIKQHTIDFKEGLTDEMLDLSSKYMPALNLGFIQLLPGSVVLDFAFLWQTSFWQGQILDISFVSTELQGANFWRCYLEQTDFGGANLTNAKLKTNLKETRNLSPAQFFSTQEWAINILNGIQINKFFPEQNEKNKTWSEWTGNEEERIMLESSINKPEWI